MVVVDARPIDANTTPDTGTTPDARPIDAMMNPADAGADAIICPVNACTGLHAGLNCVAAGELNCVITAGCIAPAAPAQACGQRQTCKDNIGCECDDDAACTAGAGTYCGSNTSTFACSEDEDGCFFQDGDPVECAVPETCQGAAGAAECLCPPIDTLEQGHGCSPVNDRQCSVGNTAVLKCVSVGACLVWDDGTLLPDATEPGDNCESSGLTCQNKQCVCPLYDGSDLYTNGHPLVTEKRKRRQLVQNGLQSPAICSFETVTVGLQNALSINGPGHANRARVILDNCDDAPPAGTGSCVPVLYDQNGTTQKGENGPLHVPKNVEVLTVQHPEVAGGTGIFTPDAFVVVMNNYSLPNPDGLTAAWTVSDTGRIAGFTIIEGGCDIDGDTQTDEYCSDRYRDWPNVMVQLLDFDGFRFNPGNTTESGRNEAKVEHMHISGAGGPLVDTDATLTGGGFAADADTGYVIFTPDDDSIVDQVDDLISGSNPDSVFLAFYDPSGATGNFGAFGPVVTVDEDGDPSGSPKVAFRFYNPNGVTGGYNGAFLVSHVGDIDVGIAVGRDDLNHFDYAGPTNELFGDTNATLFDVRVSHFASSGGGGGRGEPDGVEANGGTDFARINAGRIGVLVDDDFPGDPVVAGQPGDRVQFNGGLLWVNDTGMAVTDGRVILGPSNPAAPAGDTNPPFEIDFSTGQGLEVYDLIQTAFGHSLAVGLDQGEAPRFFDTHENTEVIANDILVHNTQWEIFWDSPVSTDWINKVPDGDDNTGNGINVTGDGTSVTFFDIDGDGIEDAADCFDLPDVDCSNDTVVVFTMNGGQSSDNDNDGLAVLTLENNVDRQNVNVTNASFLSNGWNGVDFANCVGNAENGSCPNGRLYNAHVSLESCTEQFNGTNGVFVELNAFASTTEITGGLIDSNGVDDGEADGSFADDDDVVPVFAEVEFGHGILGRANATIITDAAADGTTKLQVTNNGLSGATADLGHMIFSNTAFDSNGENDLCGDGEDGRGYGVGITEGARLTMEDCEVNANHGAGLVIDDDGDDVFLVAKLPQTVTLTQANTVESSVFDLNEGIYECEEDTSHLQTFPTDGVEVTPIGRLHFVNAPSEIKQNKKNGLDVAGQLPYAPGGAVGAPTSIDSIDNGIDGIVVSCQIGDTEIGNLKRPIDPDFFRICGFAQLINGSSVDNDENGVRVNGSLLWREGTVTGNEIDGVVVDHAEVAIADPTTGPDTSWALGWDPTTVSHAFPAPIRSKFLSTNVSSNARNGYTVLSAPWADEASPNDLCPTDIEEDSLFDATDGTDVESSRPICDWGFEIAGDTQGSAVGGVISLNGAWGVQIGTAGQAQNIFAHVGDAQIFSNGLDPTTNLPSAANLGGGIDVRQNAAFGTNACDNGSGEDRCQCDNSARNPALDETVGCTATTILSNNIFANGGPGLHAERSFQKALATVDRRTISANEFHHNAVTPANLCTVGSATQFAAQVIFEGPLGQTDPSVTNVGTDAFCVDDPVDADDSGACIGPNQGEYPADFQCYWGAPPYSSATPATDPASADRIDSIPECNSMNNPNGARSGGINNHCLWNGTQCRIAWDIGGREGTEACDTSRNRFFAYVNDDSEDPFTQRGVSATEGAYVRARRDIWGTGGANNGAFESSQGNSRVDTQDDCGSVSTCP